MPIMEISIVPIGTPSASVSKYVVEALRVLEREEGITYRLCPMGTVVEADSVEALFEVAKKMHVRSLAGEVQRIVTSIKIDDRTDKGLTMQGKIRSVEDKM